MPFKAKKLIGTGIYVEKKPHLKFTKHINQLKNGSYLISSEIMNWSNLAILVDRILDPESGNRPRPRARRTNTVH